MSNNSVRLQWISEAFELTGILIGSWWFIFRTLFWIFDGYVQTTLAEELVVAGGPSALLIGCGFTFAWLTDVLIKRKEQFQYQGAEDVAGTEH